MVFPDIITYKLKHLKKDGDDKDNQFSQLFFLNQVSDDFNRRFFLEKNAEATRAMRPMPRPRDMAMPKPQPVEGCTRGR